MVDLHGSHTKQRLGAMALVLACSLDPVAARADACGHQGLVVTGMVDETVDACRAFVHVSGPFEAYGHSVEPAFSLSFEPRVVIDLVDASDGSVNGTP